MKSSNNFRKYFVWALAGLLVIFLMTRLFNYLNTSTISVTSGEQDTVLIVGVSINGHQNSYSSQAVNHLSVRLHAGEYTITSQGHIATISKTVNVRKRQKLTYNLVPPAVVTPEPVTGSNAVDISVNDSRLYYINPDESELYNIDSQDNVNLTNTGVAFQSVKWTSPGNGIGEDNNENLFVLSNGTATALAMPAGFTANERISYAVSAGQVYLSIGNNVYAGSEAGNFQKIYTAESAPVQLIPSSLYLGVVTVPDRGAKGSTITLVTPAGRFVKSASINGSAVGVWSPDGTKLAFTSSDANGEILDSSLTQIASLPNNNTTNAWLNSSTLLYGSSNDLWSYDTDTKDSVLLAEFAPGNSINEVSIASSKDYVYLATQDSTGNAELARVGLHGQKAPSIVYELPVFFPKNMTGCSINYVNFVSATLLVTTPSSDATCQQAVSSELTNDNLNLQSLRVNYVQSNAGD